jgi:hypothetical protein
VVALVYWALRRQVELAVLRGRSERSKELELLVLRQQLQVLQQQVERPRLRPQDRVLLAALSRSLPRSARPSKRRMLTSGVALLFDPFHPQTSRAPLGALVWQTRLRLNSC